MFMCTGKHRLIHTNRQMWFSVLVNSRYYKKKLPAYMAIVTCHLHTYIHSDWVKNES